MMFDLAAAAAAWVQPGYKVKRCSQMVVQMHTTTVQSNVANCMWYNCTQPEHKSLR